MLVYRMENDKGFGPFISANPVEFAKVVPWVEALPEGDGLMSRDDTHPHHLADIPDSQMTALDPILMRLGLAPVWKVGTKDREQFLHWFPVSSFSYFQSHGYHVAEYSVPPSGLMTGNYQVVFSTEAAKLVKSEPLEQFAKESDNA